jgi:hypothetical protein
VVEGLSQLLLGALVVLWAAILTPPLLRARAANRAPVDFNDFYSSLSQVAGRRGSRAALPADPHARRRAAQMHRRTAERRRRVLATLGGAVGITFLAASFGSGIGPWMLFGASVMLLLGYVALLVYMRRAARPAADLRYLRTPMLAPEFVLRRSS